MIGLWVAAAILAAGAGALMLYRAARGAAGASDPSLAVYRRALAEIDELAARDLLAPDEKRLVRAEAARRLLNASDRVQALIAAGGPAAPLIAAVLVAVSAGAIYLMVGSPGMPDQPFAARLVAWRAHPERYPPAALAAALGAIADERPRDIEPLRQLAALDLSLDDGGGAVHALRRAMALAPQRADIPAMLGEVLVLQGKGAISPDARALFARAVRLDPSQAAARYYLAKARIADGDVAGGTSDWRALLASLPANDAQRAPLAQDIAAVDAHRRASPARRAGRRRRAAAPRSPPPFGAWSMAWPRGCAPSGRRRWLGAPGARLCGAGRGPTSATPPWPQRGRVTPAAPRC